MEGKNFLAVALYESLTFVRFSCLMMNGWSVLDSLTRRRYDTKLAIATDGAQTMLVIGPPNLGKKNGLTHMSFNQIKYLKGHFGFLNSGSAG